MFYNTQIHNTFYHLLKVMQVVIFVIYSPKQSEDYLILRHINLSELVIHQS